MKLNEMLIVIPHSGILIPHEISVESLSSDFPRLIRNVDWYTNWLYDFRDIINNSCLEFPYCSLILEANRDPEDLDSSVPLKDVLGESVYQPNLEPGLELRQTLAGKYLNNFHEKIEKEIGLGKAFMLDAHSTVAAKGVSDNQIELMTFQISKQTGQRACFCPDIFVDSYARALARRLPDVKVTVNESKYHNIYGHVCGAHSIDSIARVGDRVPAILQETNQQLYMNSDRTPNLRAIETLRRAFAGALVEMIRTIQVAL